VTRIRPIAADDRLVAAVIDQIGDAARDLADDAATSLVAVADSIEGGAPVAGLLARGTDGWEVRTTPGGDVAEVVAALVGHAADRGGGPLRWFCIAATDEDRRAAAQVGLSPTRRILQMRSPLPLSDRATIRVRAYEPDRDREAWLELNNRAFAWHPDQGGWSGDDLLEREQEPWFDPAGFLLHEVDGRLAGFCWTKVHVAHEPPLGEIYVIAVDPDAHGRGLGRELTLAGLDHLAARGLEIGMLYVEDDNEAALGLYRRLGFHTHQEDIFFAGAAHEGPSSAGAHSDGTADGVGDRR
jgi:mycothiol synthase